MRRDTQTGREKVSLADKVKVIKANEQEQRTFLLRLELPPQFTRDGLGVLLQARKRMPSAHAASASENGGRETEDVPETRQQQQLQRHRRRSVGCTHRLAASPILQDGIPTEHCYKILSKILPYGSPIEQYEGGIQRYGRRKDEPVRYRRVQTRHSQTRVGRRWTETLHADEPGWRCERRDGEGFFEFVREVSWAFLAQVGFEFFAFVVAGSDNQTKRGR
jgi:hypothetical protein